MRRIYLRAGLFAEGPTDYAFLRRLIPRLLTEITAASYPGQCDVEDEAFPLDAPGEGGGRAEKIKAAVARDAELFELLVIHADGDADPRASRKHCVEPGLAAIRAASPESPLYAAACVPVREIEAWMLTDLQVFRELGAGVTPTLPSDPERVDAKPTLTQILDACGVRRRGRVIPSSIYEFFGERVRLATLRPLPAFKSFAADLAEAVRRFVADHGHRPD